MRPALRHPNLGNGALPNAAAFLNLVEKPTRRQRRRFRGGGTGVAAKLSIWVSTPYFSDSPFSRQPLI